MVATLSHVHSVENSLTQTEKTKKTNYHHFPQSFVALLLVLDQELQLCAVITKVLVAKDALFFFS